MQIESIRALTFDRGDVILELDTSTMMRVKDIIQQAMIPLCGLTCYWSEANNGMMRSDHVNEIIDKAIL
jgi:hypothetical protein